MSTDPSVVSHTIRVLSKMILARCSFVRMSGLKYRWKRGCRRIHRRTAGSLCVEKLAKIRCRLHIET